MREAMITGLMLFVLLKVVQAMLSELCKGIRHQIV